MATPSEALLTDTQWIVDDLDSVPALKPTARHYEILSRHWEYFGFASQIACLEAFRDNPEATFFRLTNTFLSLPTEPVVET